MKRDTWIKTSFIAVMGIALGCYAVYLYEHAVVDFNRQARLAFEKALERELADRKVNDSLSSIASSIDVSKIGEMPQTVWVDKGNGRIEYKISAEKHQQNVTKDAETRLIHSMALEQKPIMPDTLNAVWQQIMKESHLTGMTALRITTTDVDADSISLLTSDYASFTSLDPLFVCTLGYRCEVEIMGIADGSWWSVLIRCARVHLVLFLTSCVLACLFAVYLIRKQDRSPLMKEVIKTQLVKELPGGEEGIYRIREGLVLYADRNLLVADGKEITFMPQSCTLFNLLLKADGYELSDAAIIAQLWPDNSGTGERLSQAVKRLRAPLKAQSSVEVRRTSSCSYKLVVLTSPEQN